MKMKNCGTFLALSMATALVIPTLATAQAGSTLGPESRYSVPYARPASGGQSATLLPDGQWLLLGGERDGTVTRDAILVEAKTNRTLPLASGLNYARSGHTATVLPDGSVLVLGGVGVDGKIVAVAERSNAQRDTFLATPLRLLARTEHTATLLTDGRLLVVGGLGTEGEPIADVELLDPATGVVERFDARMETARFGHLAALLPSAPVLIWGGLDRRLHPAINAELFEPGSQLFRPLDRTTLGYLPDPAAANATPVITGLHPDPEFAIALDPTFTLRFSTPLAGATLTADSVTLIGPNGVIPIRVVAAEGGLLAFVTPAQDLHPQATYTLLVRGAKSPEGLALPFTALPWRTGKAPASVARSSEPSRTNEGAALGPSGTGSAVSSAAATTTAPAAAASRATAEVVASPVDGLLTDPGFTLSSDLVTSCGKAADEAWIPDLASVPKRGWISERAPSVIPKLLARMAPTGETAIAGQILRLNGQPLPGVTVRAGERVTQSDQYGLFLLRNVTPGAQVLTVDGASADCAGADYGYYEIRVDAQAGNTTVLSFPVWLSKIDTANAVTLSAPTTREVVITHPQLPGLEVRIPAGTLIRDRAGKIVTRVSITPIPNDRPPYPMPEIAEFPVYFTLQPGGARLEGADGRPKQAQVIYPNYTNLPEGTSITFWSYDASDRAWHPYGTGRVSADAQSIEPGEGVGLYQFTGFSVSADPDPPPCNCGGGGAGPGGGGGGPPPTNEGPGNPADPNAGDPVYTASGQFVHANTDFQIADVVPLTLRRLHFSQDGRAREFGRGMLAGLEQYLYNPNPGNYAELWLATSGGGRVVFTCTTGCSTYSTAQYVASSDPGYFFQATMRFLSASGWEVTTNDGAVYVFYKVGAKLMSITDRFGNATSYLRAGGPNSPLTKIQSPNGRFIAFTYDAGNRITRAEDNIGRAWTYVYDASGRMTAATNPAGGQWQYTWDGASYRMLTVRDPRGNVMVANQYDANGRVTQQTYADATTNLFAYALSGTTVTEAQVTDRRGNIRKIEFDAGSRVSRNTFALGRPEQQITTYSRQAVTNLLTSMTDALGRRTDYTYDAKGNLLTMTSLAGTANAVTTTYTYTAAFNQIAGIKDPLNRTTTLTYNTFGNLTRITDPLGQQTNMTYDAQGQVLTVKNALNFTTTYTYDAGMLASSKDPLNRTTTFYTDGVGRTVRVKDPLGNAAQTGYDALDRVTQTSDALGNTARYEYDGNGNLTAHVDQRGGRTSYAFDAMNRLVGRQDTLLNSESYSYDAGSKLARFIDRKSQVYGFSYDALNRRTQSGFGATVGNPTNYGSTIGYTYDGGNRLTQANDSLNGGITREYDGLDRLTGETTGIGTVAYSYDAAGRRLTRTVPGQANVTYTWDNANRLTGIVQGTQSVSFGYDNANRRTSVTLPNGIVVSYGYDNASQVTSITYAKGATTLGDLIYTYDNAGRRISIGGGFARTGLPAAIATASVNANNQLRQWGAPTLTYDPNGNLTADGTYTYTWNARNQIVQLQQGGSTVASYQYDAFGRRTEKTINGATTRFVYDGQNFVQERDSANIVTADLVIGLGLDDVYARTKGSGTNSFLVDHIGSIIAESDAAGGIQTSYDYEPYGKTTQTGAQSDDSQRYTGREQDLTTVYFYRARYYSPDVGRFVSEDPMRLNAGPNYYSYVSDSPVNGRDPQGLFGPGYPRPPGWPNFPPGWETGNPPPPPPKPRCLTPGDAVSGGTFGGMGLGGAIGLTYGFFQGGEIGAAMGLIGVAGAASGVAHAAIAGMVIGGGIGAAIGVGVGVGIYMWGSRDCTCP